MRIVFILILLFVSICDTRSNVLLSGLYNDFYRMVTEINYTNASFRFSLDQDNKLLFLIEGKDRYNSVVFGDVFINFGRGLILGDPKYHYFTKYIYEFRLGTNSYYSFNYYTRDRNYDKVEDIFRGFSFRINYLFTFFVLTDEKVSFSNAIVGGILKISDIDILITKIDNFLLSLDFRKINLFNLGIVFDIEGGMKVKNQPEFGIGGLIEWNYRKLELAVEGRVATSNFYTQFSDSFFSRLNKKNGIIISSSINEEKYLLSLANKLLIYDNETEDEFYLFFGYKIFRNTFLDLEIINDYYQSKTFFSFYPFFDFENVNLYIKNILSVDTNADFYIEMGGKLKMQPIIIKTKLLVPITSGRCYFISSTDTRDIFGENLDIVLSTTNTISAVTTVNFRFDWLNFDFGVNLSQYNDALLSSIFFIFKITLN